MEKSEVIGGRTLRSRRSLAAKKTDEKENIPEVIRTKTPAKTPRRKKSVPSLSSLADTPKLPKSFATVQEDEELATAKGEIIELQEELSMVRKDKMELEAQLQDALDMPMQPNTDTDSKDKEIEELQQKMAELEKEKEDAAKLAAEKESLFQAEREKLEEDKAAWKGQFDNFRQTETDRLQRIEDEENAKEEREKELIKMMEDKEEEIERLNEENKKLASQKTEISNEKNTYGDAMTSALESLRCKLSTVEIARKDATKLAEDQKQLARDVMDTYDGKLAEMGQKYEKAKNECHKNSEKATRYRDERDKLREKVERYNKKHDDKERKRHKTPPRDPRRRGGSDDTDSRPKEHHSRAPKVDIDPPSDLELTSQYMFQEPFRRVVLKPGESPPEDAVKPKRNACMPIRVAIEPENVANYIENLQILKK